jgi:hypothetical protein
MMRQRSRAKQTVQFRCPRCGEFFLLSFDDVPAGGAGLACSNCRLDFQVRLDVSSPEEPVGRCRICGSEDFYQQKDLNPVLGLLAVLLGGVVSLLVLVVIDPVLGALCLIALVTILCVAWRLLEGCTVCYVCRSIYRGFPSDRLHGGFFQAQEERHQRQRDAWLERLLGRESP